MSTRIEEHPWLESIPTNWRVERLKTTVAFSQNGLWGDEPDSINDVVCVRVADFDRVSCRVALDDPTIRSVPASKIGRRLLKRGDLLIEKSGGGEHQPVGTVVKYDHDVRAVCSNFVARIEPKPAFDSAFLCYLHAALYILRVPHRSIKQTTGIQNLDAGSYFNEPVPLPPPEVQKRIANFLDRKTAAIDALISKKERLIELLQEKRQALITRAVTKGLDPNVPMKESGVPWFRRIPAHWELHQLRRVVDRFIDYRGRTPTKVDDGVPLITAGAVREGRIDHARAPEYMLRDEYPDFMRRGLPEVGDVVFTTEAPLGEVAQVEDTSVAFAQRIILFKVNKQRMTSDFLWLYYCADPGRSEVISRASGSTAEGIRADRLRGSLVLVPPLHEQAVVVAQVRSALAQMDPIRGKVQLQLQKLREYRQALITAAVTGKIDVSKEAA
jgi:type I restriction enzyme S subunit